jgi:hypothetical protein
MSSVNAQSMLLYEVELNFIPIDKEILRQYCVSKVTIICHSLKFGLI